MVKFVNSILMIRPFNFRFNSETAKNNYFQKQSISAVEENILKKSINEFDQLVVKLKSCGFNVHVFQDDHKNDTPDSVFPNNWITFHENKKIAIYPMFAKNRRMERDERVIKFLEAKNLVFESVYDYTSAENDGLYLEGTGSMVLDRYNKKAYCSLSERTNENLIIEFCNDFNYMPIVFNSFQTSGKKRKPIYHTNVMMCLAHKYCVICLSSIDCKKQKELVRQSLTYDNKEIIEISEAQLNLFAGNMIELINNSGSFLFMSQSAYISLTENQIHKISKYSKIIYTSVSTIENCGGGSVRCMIAEIFN